MTQSSAQSPTQALAINGGPKAVSSLTGVSEPKLGVEEFFAIAKRFGFTPDALERIQATVTNEDLLGDGPNLARYYCASPAPPSGELYEALAREKFGVPFALGVNSGTSALHSAFVGVGVGPGTEVILPALGFMATAMAVLTAGGIPVFCDVDESLQMDPTKIEACITPRTVALAPTHHWGNICDMAPIMAVANKHGLKVVEDCAQGPGAKYRGRYIGTFGDVGCFSISAYKIIGGGESGLVLANDPLTFDRICQCAEGGGLWRPDRFAAPRYEGELFPGHNFRLSEFEATINLVQLRKVDDYCRRFRAVSTRILKQLDTFAEITPQKINDADGFIGYMLRFFPETDTLGKQIATALQAEGIGAGCKGANHSPDWHLARDMYPINLRCGHLAGKGAFDDARNAASAEIGGYKTGQCPVAEDLYGREVAVGFDQWRSEDDCDRIAAGINKVLAAYCTPDPNGKRWL